MQHFSMALSSLRRWHVIGSSSTPCIIPAKCGRSLCAIPTPARLPEDIPKSLTRALRVAADAAGVYESEIPETCFENTQIEMHLVEQLVKDGVLLRMTNPVFGDVEYGLLWEPLQFRMAYRIADLELAKENTQCWCSGRLARERGACQRGAPTRHRRKKWLHGAC